MKILKEESVKIFGQLMIVQLVQYERDITYNTYPYDKSEGKKKVTITKLRFKDKFKTK